MPAIPAEIPAVEIPDLLPPEPLPDFVAVPESAEVEIASEPPPAIAPDAGISTPPPSITAPVTTGVGNRATQLQINRANLLHIQTNTVIELPPELTVIHLGKPNDRIPPTIDVSGFPDSEIVSRIHANIRVEGDIYYLEDVGSSNGTYVNNMPLAPGNRHRLRAGDRVALGKGDKVTFIFQAM
jgi:pSer/pThr/pTyr-binding forkhead associated (FHA) protein